MGRWRGGGMGGRGRHGGSGPLGAGGRLGERVGEGAGGGRLRRLLRPPPLGPGGSGSGRERWRCLVRRLARRLPGEPGLVLGQPGGRVLATLRRHRRIIPLFCPRRSPGRAGRPQAVPSDRLSATASDNWDHGERAPGEAGRHRSASCWPAAGQRRRQPEAHQVLQSSGMQVAGQAGDGAQLPALVAGPTWSWCTAAYRLAGRPRLRMAWIPVCRWPG